NNDEREEQMCERDDDGCGCVENMEGVVEDGERKEGVVDEGFRWKDDDGGEGGEKGGGEEWEDGEWEENGFGGGGFGRNIKS
uniref:hypothetical protein n=1 Tax=Paenibacillus xylanexedens TaxID=528191 RepID=UPI001643275B